MGKNFQWLTFQTVNHITKGKKKGFVQALKTVFKKNTKKKEKFPQSVEKQTDESRPEDDSTVACSIVYGLFSVILFFSMILN